MQKILTVPREDRCIGCMLCCVKASLIKSNKIDFSSSYVKVVLDPATKKYKVSIDYGAIQNPEQVAAICPRKCFEIQERNEDE